MKRNFKALTLLGLVFMLLFMPLGAYAEIAMTPEEQDLVNANFFVDYYGLYSYDDAVFINDNVADLVTKLQAQDKWAHYYSASAFAAYKQNLEGTKCGIGIYYLLADGVVTVTGLVENSAAQKGGILPDDHIIAINNQLIAGMAEGEVLDAFMGEEGTEVQITVLRDKEQLNFMLVRTPFLLKSVVWEMLENNIGYINIMQFTKQTATELLEAYYNIMAQNAKGLILDLRNCPGGVVDSAVDVIGIFTEKGPAMFLETRTSYSFYMPERQQEILLPMVTLINERSASAAELVAGSLQDVDRSLLIGTQSYGKGLMQNVLELPSGAGLVFTTAKYLTKGWQDVDANHGISPDIFVAESAAQLTKAMEILQLQLGAATNLVFTYNNHTVFCDGIAREFNNIPFAEEGISYLPLRETLTSLGYEVFWYGDCVYLSNADQRIVLDLKNSLAMMNKTTYKLKMKLLSDALYLSAADLSNLLDLQINWDSVNNQLIICKN